MKKKLLSIILCICMVLTLTPAVAWGTTGTPATSVTVGGVELNADTPYLVNGAAAASGTLGQNGCTAYFNGGTLTLKDATISGAPQNTDNCGIYAGGDLIVVLQGDNAVTADASGHMSAGIYCAGVLAINGSGFLTASGGDTSAMPYTNSYGIASDGEFTVSGNANITAVGGTSGSGGNSRGISANTSVNITNAIVTAIGGTGGDSAGIYLQNDSLVIDGTAYVTATGGKAIRNRAATCHGVYCNGGKVEARDSSTLIATGGTVTGSGGFSVGVRVNNGLEISNTANVVAIGGLADCSYGVTTGVTYNGGLLVARGGIASQESKAVDGGVTVTGGTETGTQNGAYYVITPATSSPYYVTGEDVTQSTVNVDEHITWSDNNCTLNNTIIVGTDSKAITIPDGGTLTANGFNVVLGADLSQAAAGYAVYGEGILNINGTGSLVAVSGQAGSSGNPSNAIYANSAATPGLTLGGSTCITAVCNAGGVNYTGCAVGIPSEGVSVTGGRGVSIVASGDVYSKAFSFAPTGATLLGGAWGGTAAVWRATAATPTYAISLSQTTTKTFEPQIEGYESQGSQAFEVTVTNTGNQPTGDLRVDLSGTNDEAFTLSETSINGIAAGATDSFTVTPALGLGVGTHTATVTVSGDNGINESFGVSFEVTAQPAPEATSYAAVVTPASKSFTATAGYASVAGQTFTISSTGTEEITLTTPSLSGTSPEAFNLDTSGTSQNLTSSGGVAPSTTFTVTPVAGLPVGTYNAAVDFSYSGGGATTPGSIAISFRVSSQTTSHSRNNGGSTTIAPATTLTKTDDTKAAENANMGAVVFSTAKPKTGDRVVITIKPETSYENEKPIVKDKDGKVIAVTENADGTFSFVAPAGEIKVDAQFSPIFEEKKVTPAFKLSVKSKQSISLNGKPLEVAAYNVDGYNYAKLRDIASVLNGTGSRFAVSTGKGKTIILEPGKDYIPVGGELVLDKDLSASCAVSKWTVTIDDIERYLDVYNFGGNNYFKVRDLGTLLDFGVDYDKTTNTALITAK